MSRWYYFYAKPQYPDMTVHNSVRWALAECSGRIKFRFFYGYDGTANAPENGLSWFVIKFKKLSEATLFKFRWSGDSIITTIRPNCMDLGRAKVGTIELYNGPGTSPMMPPILPYNLIHQCSAQYDHYQRRPMRKRPIKN